MMATAARAPRDFELPKRGVRMPVLVLSALLLAGCTQFGPRQGQPDPALATPTLALEPADRFSTGADAPQPSEADLRWWRRFDDDDMAAWVERALNASPGITIAGEQLVQARALLQSAKAQRGVQIGAQADATLRLQRDAGERRMQPGLGLTLDFDTDLWGGLRQAEASAAAAVLRSQDLVQASRLSAAGLAARAYVEWRVARQDAALLDEVLQLQREVLRIASIRVEAGLAPVLDRDRATAELAATEAEQATAAVRVHQALGALQVLAGQRPQLPPLAQMASSASAGTDIPALSGVQPVVRPLDLLLSLIHISEPTRPY